jgi:hypothetical protein
MKLEEGVEKSDYRYLTVDHSEYILMISMSVLSQCYHQLPEAFLFHFNHTLLPWSFFVVTRRCRLYDDLSPVFEDHAGTSKSKVTNQDDLSFSKKDNPRNDFSASLERDVMDEARRCSSMNY